MHELGDTPDHTLTYGVKSDQYVEAWHPETDPIGSIVLIHGGYWRQRYGLESTIPVAMHLANNGWAVYNIEYRRLTERSRDVWAAMSEDVARAAAFAKRHPIVAIGHSAGGHLALWLATNPAAVDAVIALAPLADLRAADRRDLSGGVVRQLLGGSAGQVPAAYDEASPIERVPLGVPQLVIHGDADESVPQQLSIDYAQAARQAGDQVELLALEGVDHMQLIDPTEEIWTTIGAQLLRWSTDLLDDQSG